MTDQEIFDKVVTFLINQGGPSYILKRPLYTSPYATCLYRGPNDRKCAAGCMISDEDYNYAFEGMSAHKVPALQQFNTVLLDSLQTAHDDLACSMSHDIDPSIAPWDMDAFKARFRRVAGHNGLSAQVLQ